MPGLRKQYKFEDDDELMDEGAGAAPNVDEAVDNIDAETSAEVKETIGAAVPEPREPLPITHYNRLITAVEDAVDALSSGEIQPTPVEPAAGTQVDEVDPALWTNIVGIRAFLDAAEQAGIEEAAQYDFDPAEAVTTQEGVAAALLQIQRITRDSGLLSKVQGAAPEGEEKEPEEPSSSPTTSDDDIDAMM